MLIAIPTKPVHRLHRLQIHRIVHAAYLKLIRTSPGRSSKVIADQQRYPTPFHSAKLHLGTCSSVGMRRGTDRQRDRDL